MTTSSSITYSYLSQKIIDSKAPSEEILDSLSAQQKIESSKIKLWELCPWLPKTYFAKIKADFTSHIEANKIAESTTWSQLGYSARE
ncbi:18845_t:CDS:2, partial [Dentiscutata erythropus]